MLRASWKRSRSNALAASRSCAARRSPRPGRSGPGRWPTSSSSARPPASAPCAWRAAGRPVDRGRRRGWPRRGARPRRSTGRARGRVGRASRGGCVPRMAVRQASDADPSARCIQRPGAAAGHAAPLRGAGVGRRRADEHRACSPCRGRRSRSCRGLPPRSLGRPFRARPAPLGRSSLSLLRPRGAPTLAGPGALGRRLERWRRRRCCPLFAACLARRGRPRPRSVVARPGRASGGRSPDGLPSARARRCCGGGAWPEANRRVAAPKRDEGPLRSGAPSSREIRRRPTLPGGLPPSTIGAGGLNFRVRNGNGCDPAAMATGNLLSRASAQARRPLRTP